MKPRRSRQLSPEERKLWAEVARRAKPLPGRQLPELPEPAPSPRPTAVGPSVPLSKQVPGSTRTPVSPPLTTIERKTLVALRRGRRAIDAVIDLHGMRQAEAHTALLGFLRRSQAAGHDLILVVTGKGATGPGSFMSEERGVLRRIVPHWLRMPELRTLVLGFDEAMPHHGGSGALYVRLRRHRGPA